MKLRRLAPALALSAALSASPALGVAVAHAEEGVDAEAISEDIEEQLERGEAVEEQVNSLDEDSTAEEVAEASASVRSLGEATGSADSVQSLMGQIDRGGSSSLELKFAQLQLELSEKAKSQALERMEAISERQENQKQCSAMLNKARQLQAEGRASGVSSAIPDDMLSYLSDNGLSLPEGAQEDALTKDEWDSVIAMLETLLESLGTETQQNMTYAQDYMDQYNAYLEGANTQVKNANETLTSLARGQTMLGGEGGTGMLVTGLLGGAAAGVVGTLLVTRARARRVLALHDAGEEE